MYVIHQGSSMRNCELPKGVSRGGEHISMVATMLGSIPP